MTCKDCIHEKICDHFILQGAPWKDGGFPAEIFCDQFKPKSRFIELPCAVGDIVYRVSFRHKTVVALKVEGFLRNLASWKVHCTHLIPSWIGNQKEHIYISFASFGKTAFLTEEKAEKALAERSEGK